MRFQTFILATISCCLLTAPAYSQPELKIIGGEKTGPDEYPFMSALMFKAIEITTASTVRHTLLMSGSNDDEFSYDESSDEGPFSGEIVDCSGDLPCGITENSICLFERVRNGEGISADSSSENARSCEANDGKAAIIYNDLDDNAEGGGLFKDSITSGNAVTIPVMTVSKETKDFLTGTVEISFSEVIPTESFCGGSYIGGKWVVTAAHCVDDDLNPDSISVNIGGFNLDTDKDNVIGVKEIVIHPNYDAETINNDFALIELLQQPTGVTPVIIAPPATNAIRTAIAVGRGTTVTDDTDPDYGSVKELYAVELTTIENTVCNTTYNAIEGINPITNSMICAFNPGTLIPKGTCFGDSGGPLLVEINREPHILGITSGGKDCAQAELYDVFARVSEPGFIDMTKDLDLETTEPDGPDTGGVIGLPPGENNGGEFNIVPPGDSDSGGGTLKPSTLLILLLMMLITPRLQRQLSKRSKP